MFRRLIRLAAIPILATAVLSTAPAQAAPPTPSPQSTVQPNSTSKPPRDDSLSSGQKADIASVVNIANHAWNKKTRTLDYKKADSYDRGRTTARRQMARGILATGGKIKNISSGELKKVKAIKMGKKTSVMKANGTNHPMAVDCKGRNATVAQKRTPPAFDIKYYYDSCRTDTIITALGVCAILGGVITGMGAAAVGPAVAVVCGIGHEVLGHYQKISTIGAVWVRDHNHLLTAGAQ